MPVKNICQLFPQKKESLVTLCRLSRIRSIYFFSAKCASSLSFLCYEKREVSYNIKKSLCTNVQRDDNSTAVPPSFL